MIIIRHDRLYKFIRLIFLTVGATAEEADVLAAELSEATMMGIESHGVMRCEQYVEMLKNGQAVSGVMPTIIRESGGIAVFDCGFNLGIVSAAYLANEVSRRAKTNHIACVAGMNCNHVGRLGMCTQIIAENKLIGIAFACGSKQCHWVAPWKGKEGRLATNPISYAIPTQDAPVILDMSTSMIPEGKIRALHYQNLTLPAGMIVDNKGNPSTDPGDFYAEPMGAILPFGFEQGYKGYGLGLLVEFLGRSLVGLSICDEPDKYRIGNGLFIIAIDPAAFSPDVCFDELAGELVAYVKSSQPISTQEPVVVPGEIEFMKRADAKEKGIVLSKAIWDRVIHLAKELGIDESEIPDGE